MKVRIYRPGKNAMQSGRAGLKSWRIEPELESARVPEPLMGWTSSQDTLNQISLRFSSADEAVKYAEKMGWDYAVEEVNERIITPRNYADNFKARKKA